MDPYTFKGELYKIFETESKSNTFQKREFVIKTDGNYPQFVKFQLTQDRCQLIDGHNEGETIQVHFDLKGNEWNEKFFTNLNVWKIEAVGSSNENQPQNSDAEGGSMPTASDEVFTELPEQHSEDLDDLPF